MTTEIIKNEIKLQNTKLRNYTEQIYKQGLNIRKSFARVAVILVKIDESKCYEQDGFKDVQEYAETILGWKKANTYAMLRVGREYLDGKTYESVLPHPEGSDYSTSQLQALLPLKSVDTAQEMAEQNIINPKMTVKEIKDVVKAYKDGSLNDESEIENKKGEENNNTDEVIEAVTYKVVYTFEIMETENGEKFFMLDGEEVEKEDVINLINQF